MIFAITSLVFVATLGYRVVSELRSVDPNWQRVAALGLTTVGCLGMGIALCL